MYICLNAELIKPIDCGDYIFPATLKGALNARVDHSEDVEEMLRAFLAEQEQDIDKLFAQHYRLWVDNQLETKINNNANLATLYYLLGGSVRFESKIYSAKDVIKNYPVAIEVDELVSSIQAACETKPKFEISRNKKVAEAIPERNLEVVEDLFSLFELGLRNCLSTKKYNRIGANDYMLVYNSVFGLRVKAYQTAEAMNEPCIAITKNDGLFSGLYSNNNGTFMKISGYSYAPECINDLHIRVRDRYYYLRLVSTPMIMGGTEAYEYKPKIIEDELDDD